MMMAIDDQNIGKSVPARRTQAERSGAMCARLIAATLDCLQSEGYAGTTVSTIAARAGVSRGVLAHHFPSKAALIEATAEVLASRVRARLHQALSRVGEAGCGLEDAMLESWRTVFGAGEGRVMLEYVVASRHDRELAARMRYWWSQAGASLGALVAQYFEPLNPEDNVRELMILSQWLLRGMTLNVALSRGNASFEHFITVWCGMVGRRLRARTQRTPLPGHS